MADTTNTPNGDSNNINLYKKKLEAEKIDPTFGRPELAAYGMTTLEEQELLAKYTEEGSAFEDAPGSYPTATVSADVLELGAMTCPVQTLVGKVYEDFKSKKMADSEKAKAARKVAREKREDQNKEEHSEK